MGLPPPSDAASSTPTARWEGQSQEHGWLWIRSLSASDVGGIANELRVAPQGLDRVSHSALLLHGSQKICDGRAAFF